MNHLIHFNLFSMLKKRRINYNNSFNFVFFKQRQLTWQPTELKSISANGKVILPKFKIESTHDLNEVLQSLGLKRAFVPFIADFSGISHGSLFISQVLQKAMISVDEKGCEAAAATVVIFMPIAPMELTPPPPPPVFRADHPFAFFLVKSKKEVLFSGTFLGGE